MVGGAGVLPVLPSTGKGLGKGQGFVAPGLLPHLKLLLTDAKGGMRFAFPSCISALLRVSEIHRISHDDETHRFFALAGRGA